MKNLFLILLICFGVISCKTPQKANVSNQVSKIEQDTVRIANDEGYYSQQFLETRNNLLVTEWNSRVLQPQKYNPSLYEMQIDYRPNIDYGYEVNYKLYNYFIYFQITHKQQLTGFTPRI